MTDLQALYDELHEKYFDNRFKDYDIEIRWSNRLTARAGVCKKWRNEKKAVTNLSTWYFKKFPEDIQKILLHEMIHIDVHNHGSEFYNEVARIEKLGGEVALKSRERAKIK